MCTKALVRERSRLAGLVIDGHRRARKSLDFQERPSLTADQVRSHFIYLEEALHTADNGLFLAHIDWLADVAPNEEAVDELHQCMALMSEVIEAEVGSDVGGSAIELLAQARGALRAPRETPADFEPAALNELAAEYLDRLLAADHRGAVRLIVHAANEAHELQHIYLDVLQPVLHEIGRRWQRKLIGVSTEHYCTAATQTVMGCLVNRVFGAERIGRTAIATAVGSELHDIGMRMVADLLEIAGWDTLYLGSFHPVASIVASTAEHRPDVIALSVTCPTNISIVEELIAQLRKIDTTARTKIIVGGHAFLAAPGLAQRIGADGFAADAVTAVETCNALVADQPTNVRAPASVVDGVTDEQRLSFVPQTDSPSAIYGQIATAQRDLARRYNALRQLTGERSKLIAMITHDLRNTLNRIGMQTEVIRARLQATLQEGSANLFDQIQEAGAGAGTLLGDLITLSRSDLSDVTSIDQSMSDLAEVADTVVRRLQSHAAEQGMTLSLDAPPRLIGPVDPMALERILDNLVGNSLKYCHRGAAITVRVMDQENEHVITVEDDGPGLPSELVPELFEPFVRGRSGAVAGHGLGLAICHRLVDAHGGWITVERNSGSGTAITVSLPHAMPVSRSGGG